MPSARPDTPIISEIDNCTEGKPGAQAPRQRASSRSGWTPGQRPGSRTRSRIRRSGGFGRAGVIGTLDDVLSELEARSRPKGGVGGFTSGVPSIGAESTVGLADLTLARPLIHSR